MYDTGAGVPEDATEAVRWYRLAADQGHARAQLNLGVKYRNGEGTPQDFVEAHMWANLAASQLSGEDRDLAVRHRDDLAAQMTPDQIAEAQRRAREWTPTPEPWDVGKSAVHLATTSSTAATTAAEQPIVQAESTSSPSRYPSSNAITGFT